MNTFAILAIVVTMAAVFSYLNHRYFKLPPTIALMIMSLVLSVVLVLLARAHVVDREIRGWLEKLRFSRTLLGGMLGFLLFAVLLEVARLGDTGKPASAPEILLLFGREAGGGIALGLLLGFVVFQFMKRVDNYPLEILMTLALVMGGYTLAQALHSSGPLAMVVAGILIGNQGKTRAMTETSRKNLEIFWQLVEEFLNAVLFVLIGLESLLISFRVDTVVFGMILIPVVLLVRLITAGLPITLLRRRYHLPRRTGLFVTWGSLRGGISIALTLSLHPGPRRELIVLITYVIVVFAVVVQGLSAGAALRLLRIPQDR